MGRKKGFFATLFSPPRRRRPKGLLELLFSSSKPRRRSSLFGRGGLFDAGEGGYSYRATQQKAYRERKKRESSIFDSWFKPSKPRRKKW
jgi:hypothetical protein